MKMKHWYVVRESHSPSLKEGDIIGFGKQNPNLTTIQDGRFVPSADWIYIGRWDVPPVKDLIEAIKLIQAKDALVEERAKVIMLIEKLQLVANDPDWQSKGLKHDFDWYLAESKKQIESGIESGEPEDQRCRRLGEPNGWTDPEGKIGPDISKPRSWQITEERIATISASLKVLERLKKVNTDTDHCYLDAGIAVLRAMLGDGNCLTAADAAALVGPHGKEHAKKLLKNEHEEVDW